jgi:hypothetical protein
MNFCGRLFLATALQSLNHSFEHFAAGGLVQLRPAGDYGRFLQKTQNGIDGKVFESIDFVD